MTASRSLGLAVFAAIASVALWGQTGCQVAPAATVDHGDFLFRNNCAPCHGNAAEGKAPVAAPSLAGLPSWYVTEQLHKFRGGIRGTHFDDLEGMRMRPMSLTLNTETDIQAVSMYIAGLPPQAHAATVTGDAAKGKEHYTRTCVACHGADGAGMEAVGSPPLTLQPDWYVAKQIGKLRAGVRGTNPKDTRGAQMRPMANTLPDEQAVTDVVAYIQTLRK
jgi:cytochrome c553